MMVVAQDFVGLRAGAAINNSNRKLPTAEYSCFIWVGKREAGYCLFYECFVKLADGHTYAFLLLPAIAKMRIPE
jgi:hypothetical protein